MTTATANKRTEADGFVAELEAVQQQLEEARQERGRLGVEARANGDELARVEAELGHLARSAVDQFGPDGQPKKGTEAAKLKAKLEQAASSRWPEIIAGADERIAQLQAQVGAILRTNEVELARREFRAGEDELAKLDVLAEQMLAVLSTLEGHNGRLTAIAAAAAGRIDGRDISTDGRLDTLRSLLSQHADFRPPRSVTLTPLVGEQPSVLRGRQGGWVSAGHGSDSHAPPDEQPPRLEPRR